MGIRDWFRYRPHPYEASLLEYLERPTAVSQLKEGDYVLVPGRLTVATVRRVSDVVEDKRGPLVYAYWYVSDTDCGEWVDYAECYRRLVNPTVCDECMDYIPGDPLRIEMGTDDVVVCSGECRMAFLNGGVTNE